MPGLEHGYSRAIREIMGSTIILLTLDNMYDVVLSDWLPVSWLLLLKFSFALSLITLPYVMQYWGTNYLIGWVFGVMILTIAGLVDALEVIIYLGIPLIILIIRLIKNIEENTIISII